MLQLVHRVIFYTSNESVVISERNDLKSAQQSSLIPRIQPCRTTLQHQPTPHPRRVPAPEVLLTITSPGVSIDDDVGAAQTELATDDAEELTDALHCP